MYGKERICIEKKVDIKENIEEFKRFKERSVV